MATSPIFDPQPTITDFLSFSYWLVFADSALHQSFCATFVTKDLKAILEEHGAVYSCQINDQYGKWSIQDCRGLHP
ncbi:hypothetical protein L484_001259 [Morus notabilis]|uniref:Uncharacterized protein n=1 Tax=Morus notabilis TaxID=981085 RepID=W9R0G0_9ROSA|nr:hypothetical protein L484_001259 [Morus notabilis]